MNERTEKQDYEKKSLSFYVFMFLGFLVSVIAVFMVGIYKFGWENAAAQKFTEIIPLPAAVVAGKPVSFSDFWKLEQASKVSKVETASKAIVSSLVKDKIAGILVKEKNIQISPDEFEQYYAHLLFRFGIDQNVAPGEISRLFGLAEKDFKRLVVLPDFKRNKLAIWWQEGNRPNKAWGRAQDLEKKLLEGLTFQEGAGFYSDDEDSKYIGGDLGFLRPIELPPWFRATVENLKIGDMSRVVVGPDGYYIFQAAARSEDTAKNAIQVKQIFIKNDGFDEFWEEQTVRFRILVLKKI